MSHEHLRFCSSLWVLLPAQQFRSHPIDVETAWEGDSSSMSGDLQLKLQDSSICLCPVLPGRKRPELPPKREGPRGWGRQVRGKRGCGKDYSKLSFHLRGRGHWVVWGPDNTQVVCACSSNLGINSICT